MRRDDGSEGYRSTWRLNGADARASEVAELVSRLNIQFDNLCQVGE